MSQLTNLEQEEQLNTPDGVNENLSREAFGELMERDKLEGTPFYIIGNKEYGYFLGLGKHRLTTPKPTKEQVLLEMNSEMWNIILKLVVNTHLKIMENIEELTTNGNTIAEPNNND